jgi:hypothetical protein
LGFFVIHLEFVSSLNQAFHESVDQQSHKQIVIFVGPGVKELQKKLEGLVNRFEICSPIFV